MSKIMVRRSFVTINVGNIKHIIEGEDDPQIIMTGYYEFLTKNLDWEAMGFTGVALALEQGDTGNWHVQGYLEHKQMRFSTLGKKLNCQPTAFQTVIDSKGSYNYCTGKGVHKDKTGVFGRYEWGEFKLHGDTHSADLKMLVGLIIDGAKPADILKEYPYAYCVHRKRIWDLYLDLRDIGRAEEKFTSVRL